MDEAVIWAEDLCKEYGGRRVVDRVNFRLGAGERLALLGTSGSGKTTTLKMLNRLVEPSSGHIYIHGKEVRAQEAALLRRQLGYVIQRIGLFPHYTVAENIGVVPRLLGWPREKIRNRAAELLDLLGLPAGQYLDRLPAALSGGQQQRVGIARALAASPPILLMDEPFGALDPITRGQIHEELLGLEAFRQTTVVLVTHDIAEAVRLGTQVGLMDGGRMVQLGAPKELVFTPASPFVKEFFDVQRLQTEWEVLRLADVLPWLAVEAEPVPSDAQVIGAETTLHEVLESGGQAGGLWLALPNVTGRSSAAHVLEAYYHFKVAQQEGGAA